MTDGMESAEDGADCNACGEGGMRAAALAALFEPRHSRFIDEGREVAWARNGVKSPVHGELGATPLDRRLESRWFICPTCKKPRPICRFRHIVYNPADGENYPHGACAYCVAKTKSGRGPSEFDEQGRPREIILDASDARARFTFHKDEWPYIESMYEEIGYVPTWRRVKPGVFKRAATLAEAEAWERQRRNQYQRKRTRETVEHVERHQACADAWAAFSGV